VVIVAGTDSAFDALYRAHGPALYRYAARRVGPVVAEDVVAEVFVVAWRRFADVPGDDPLPWLYKTAAFVIANERRRAERAATLLTRLQSEPIAGPVADERSRQLLAAMDSLSESDQEVLRLQVWEDLDGQRLAQALGCSRTAAGVRAHRAKARLRKALSGTYPRTGSKAPPTLTGRSASYEEDQR
jgi:RNA polymerase sigma-70 factor (ECF subfamily)